MTNPIRALMELNQMTLDLDRFQVNIDEARSMSEDQAFQRALDRKQAEINYKRVVVSDLMAHIRNRN
jgi:hypothetical protein